MQTDWAQLSPEQQIETLLKEYERNPIDLLNLNDAAGENAYLHAHKRSYMEVLYQVPPILPAGTRTRVLEIGSFLGIVSIALSRSGYKMISTDLPLFVRNPRLQKLYDDNEIALDALDLKDYANLSLMYSELDGVILCETLEHLNFNPVPLIEEIYRILRPGGIFYLTVPNQASIRNRIKLLRGQSIHNSIHDFHLQLDPMANMSAGLHWREYTRSEVHELLTSCGFEVRYSYYYSESPRAYLYDFLPDAFKPQINVIAVKI